MKIATGKVIGGKVVVEGVTLEEGTSVTVIAKDGEGAVTLSPVARRKKALRLGHKSGWSAYWIKAT
jgi:hypothetical protein